MSILGAPLKCFLVEKDKDWKIITANSAFKELAGAKDIEQIKGLSDYELPWSEYTHLYLPHHIDALAGEIYSSILPVKNYAGDINLYMHTRIGKKDAEGNISSLLNHFVEMADPAWQELNTLLAKKSPVPEQGYYINKSNLFNLTPKESEILFYLTQGKTAKQIARILLRSFRTIESHIARLKAKLHCRTTAELIIFAMTHGFMRMLPKEPVGSLVEKLKV